MHALKPTRRWKPTASALVVTALSAVTLLMAAFDAGGAASDLISIPALSASLGVIVGLLHARRLRSVLFGTVAGLFLGIASASRLLGHAVMGVYAVTVATLTLFAALGFLVGAFIEFVLFLHFVAHGGKPREYPGNDAA